MAVLRTHILDVGHGDTIILELPNDAGEKVIVVIDCCDSQATQTYLAGKDITPNRVPLVIATHPHEDHIGGLQDLLKTWKDAGIEVEMFWDSGYEHTSKLYEDLTDYLENNEDIITWYPRTGMSGVFGNVEVRVLAPPDPLLSGSASDCNNASIVLLVKYKRAKLLFTGDAQFANWAQISVNQQEWMGAQVLKVAHHGSKHGSFLEVLEEVDPKHAIITGEDSLTDPEAYFPHPITLEALKELKELKEEEIYCTSRDKNIVIESKGNGTHDIKTDQ